METKIKTTGAVLLTDELRSFVEEKLGKIEKLVKHDTKPPLAEVELGTTSAGQRTGDVFRAEINFTFENGFARGEATRDTLHTAIDEAVRHTRREVRKTKDKNRDLVRRGASQVKAFFQQFGK